MGMTERLHNAAYLNYLHKNLLLLKSLCDPWRVTELQVLQCVEVGPGVGRPGKLPILFSLMQGPWKRFRKSQQSYSDNSVRHYQDSGADG